MRTRATWEAGTSDSAAAAAGIGTGFQFVQPLADFPGLLPVEAGIEQGHRLAGAQGAIQTISASTPSDKATDTCDFRRIKSCQCRLQTGECLHEPTFCSPASVKFLYSVFSQSRL